MKSNDKKVSKIIIVSLVIIYTLIAVITIVYLICMKKKDNKEIDCIRVEYYLAEKTDIGFLDTNIKDTTKYQIISSYEEFINIENSIDPWSEEVAIRVMYDIKEMNKSNEKKIDTIKQDGYDKKDYRYKSIQERAKKIKQEFNSERYNEDYFEEYNLLLVEKLVFNQVIDEIKITDISTKNGILNVNMKEEAGGVVGGGEGILFFVPINKKEMEGIKNVNININYKNTSVPGVAYKPIIYLYPTKDTNINVSLQNSENLICSYPKYIDGWNVIASKDGTLLDLKTNKTLYSLYYEAINTIEFKVEEDGFIVEGKDVISFLEEKLTILGLNEKEIEEFIIYWLPILEKNRYNYIRFATSEEINKNIPLEISPSPDNIIRVFMTYKPLDHPIEVEEQNLIMPKREGFVTVEWGGTEIEN